MSQDERVAAVVGSMREGSKTRVAAEVALDAAAAGGAAVELVDLRDYDLPPFSTEDRDAGDSPALRATLDEADAILLATPNYHGSYSGVLKNALDYCGRDEFRGKTVGLLEVAGGSFPRPALIHLRTVARTINAWTLPHEVAIPDARETIQDGTITDPAIEERVRELGEQLVEYAGVDRFPDVADRGVPPAEMD